MSVGPMGGMIFENNRWVEAEAFRCSDCDKVHAFADLDPIQHFEERVAAGEICPAGQCPVCEALCHVEGTPSAETLILRRTLSEEPGSAPPPKGLFVRLESVGNPDKGQYRPVSEPSWFEVYNLAHAVTVCLGYIHNEDLGGGNWPAAAGAIYQDGEQIARVSYNGRLWKPDGIKYPTGA